MDLPTHSRRAVALAVFALHTALGVHSGDVCGSDSFGDCPAQSASDELSLLQWREMWKKEDVELEVPGMFRVRRQQGELVSVQTLPPDRPQEEKRRTSLMAFEGQQPTVNKRPLVQQLQEVEGLSVKGDRFTHVGESKILVATLLVPDDTDLRYSTAGDHQYADWIVALLNNTAQRTQRHGHSLAVRMQKTLPPPEGQAEGCRQNPEPTNCLFHRNRENVNWEKFRLMLDYLEERPERFSHILFLDADATLMNPDPNHDTLRVMASEMDRRDVSLLMADEDWRGGKGVGRAFANGGIMMWKNTEYSKELLRAILRAHFNRDGQGWACKGNDQMCIQSYIRSPKLAKVTAMGGDSKRYHSAVLSGTNWNRHPCVMFGQCHQGGDNAPILYPNRGLQDPTLEIMHFMGAAKNAWGRAFPEQARLLQPTLLEQKRALLEQKRALLAQKQDSHAAGVETTTLVLR